MSLGRKIKRLIERKQRKAARKASATLCLFDDDSNILAIMLLPQGVTEGAAGKRTEFNVNTEALQEGEITNYACTDSNGNSDSGLIRPCVSVRAGVRLIGRIGVVVH